MLRVDYDQPLFPLRVSRAKKQKHTHTHTHAGERGNHLPRESGSTRARPVYFAGDRIFALTRVFFKFNCPWESPCHCVDPSRRGVATVLWDTCGPTLSEIWNNFLMVATLVLSLPFFFSVKIRLILTEKKRKNKKKKRVSVRDHGN